MRTTQRSGQNYYDSIESSLYKKFPYSERYVSLIYSNRLKLIVKVMVLRAIENALICVVLPHSLTFLRCSGFFPEVNSGVKPEDLNVDHATKNMLILGVVATTCCIFFSQQVCFNRTYLAGVASAAGNWEKREVGSGSGRGRAGGEEKGEKGAKGEKGERGVGGG